MALFSTTRLQTNPALAPAMQRLSPGILPQGSGPQGSPPQGSGPQPPPPQPLPDTGDAQRASHWALQGATEGVGA